MRSSKDLQILDMILCCVLYAFHFPYHHSCTNHITLSAAASNSCGLSIQLFILFLLQRSHRTTNTEPQTLRCNIGLHFSLHLAHTLSTKKCRYPAQHPTIPMDQTSFPHQSTTTLSKPMLQGGVKYKEAFKALQTPSSAWTKPLED